jgi:hypothetical protein
MRRAGRVQGVRSKKLNSARQDAGQKLEEFAGQRTEQVAELNRRLVQRICAREKKREPGDH